MKKYRLIYCVVSLFLFSCSTGFASLSQTQAPLIPETKHLQLAAKSTSNKKYSRPFPSKLTPTGSNIFIFDPRKLRWAAYNKNGKLVKTGKASGGKSYCKDIRRTCRTPTGIYSVYAKRGASCKSSKYPVGRGGAPMPYCTFFRGGYAIHGSYNVPNYNASHGCIRVVPSAAKWLQKFLHYGSTVIVRSY